MNQGTINGYNFTDFGLYVGSTNDQNSYTDDFDALPKRKESVSHDFSDENGMDIDLAEPRFGAREFTLPVRMIAHDRADFITKRDALFTQFKRQGTLALHLNSLGETYHLFFKEQQNYRRVTRPGTIGYRADFDLVFGETDPNDNFEDVYIITDQNEFIIA